MTHDVKQDDLNQHNIIYKFILKVSMFFKTYQYRTPIIQPLKPKAVLIFAVVSHKSLLDLVIKVVIKRTLSIGYTKD